VFTRKRPSHGCFGVSPAGKAALTDCAPHNTPMRRVQVPPSTEYIADPERGQKRQILAAMHSPRPYGVGKHCFSIKQPTSPLAQARSLRLNPMGQRRTMTAS